MKAIIVGAVESTRVALKCVGAAPGWEVAALITLPQRLAARHSDFEILAPYAEQLGAEIIEAPDSNAPEVLERVRAIAPDLVLVIGWSQICKPAFIEACGGQVVGYHPAPVPLMRGRAAIPWTILLQQNITASTLFWLDEGVDSGPILSQRFFLVAPDETASSLIARHMEALAPMLAESLAKIASGEMPAVPQDERLATWTAKRTKEDGRIDWQASWQAVWRLIRAVGRPYPGAFTQMADSSLTIWRAEPWDEAWRFSGLPGQVVSIKNNEFGVLCGQGGLWVCEWESECQTPPKLHVRLS